MSNKAPVTGLTTKDNMTSPAEQGRGTLLGLGQQLRSSQHTPPSGAKTPAALPETSPTGVRLPVGTNVTPFRAWPRSWMQRESCGKGRQRAGVMPVGDEGRGPGQADEGPCRRVDDSAGPISNREGWGKPKTAPMAAGDWDERPEAGRSVTGSRRPAPRPCV